MRNHVVCLPLPVQSRIGAMLKLANILHGYQGFFITFVNTDFNHRRMLKSGGLLLDDLTPDFRFISICDGLPTSDADATHSRQALCDSCSTYMVQPFLDLLVKLTEDEAVPPITHVLSDGFMNFIASPAAKKFNVPLIHLFPVPASSVMAMKYYRLFLEKYPKPLRGMVNPPPSDVMIDWIPGMKNMRPCDMPDFYGATVDDDAVVRFNLAVIDRMGKADATIINTFEELEQVVLDTLSSILPNVYAIGPLHLLLDQIPRDKSVSKRVSGSLWEEHVQCLEWLDSKVPGSVVYVNFGSLAVLTNEQLVEFAMGLANSEHPFLWILRPDLVIGETAVLPPGFAEETKDRGFLSGWCPQEKVLNHRSVGGFLTHCGWNSVVESLTAGVPMLCWPTFGDQLTNARYACEEWKVGLEVEVEVKRDNVEKAVREMLGEETGKELKRRAMEWRQLAGEAVTPTGSSVRNLKKLVKKVFA